MTAPVVFAVGSPPTFRQAVGRAVEGIVESVDYAPSVIAAEEMIAREGAAGVIVISPGVKEADALGFSEWVARTAPASAVVLVRDFASATLITAAMRAGMRDVVDMSRGGEELREALERALDWSSKVGMRGGRVEPAPVRQGTMVAIFSSKGGSGKTFVATSLALAVAKRWKVDTAMVDLDLDMGDVYSYYGLEPKLAVNDMLAIGNMTDRESLLAAGTPVIDHLWAYGAPPDPAVEPPAGEAVGKLLRSVRDRFPFSVVDATAEYSDQALAAFDLADIICLVAALDVVGVRHLAKALETLQLIGVSKERIRVVLNRADSKVGLSPQQVEKLMHLKVDAMIPSSRLVPMSLNKGRPVYLEEPRSEVAMSLDRLAELIATPVLGPPLLNVEGTPRRRWFSRTPRSRAAAPAPAPEPAAEADGLEISQDQDAEDEPMLVPPPPRTRVASAARGAAPKARTAAKRAPAKRAPAASSGRAATNGHQARGRTVRTAKR